MPRPGADRTHRSGGLRGRVHPARRPGPRRALPAHPRPVRDGTGRSAPRFHPHITTRARPGSFPVIHVHRYVQHNSCDVPPEDLAVRYDVKVALKSPQPLLSKTLIRGCLCNQSSDERILSNRDTSSLYNLWSCSIGSPLCNTCGLEPDVTIIYNRKVSLLCAILESAITRSGLIE